MKKKLFKTVSRRTLREILRSSVSRYSRFIAGAGTFLLVVSPHQGHALNLYDGSTTGNNLEINLTTTVEYSTFYRVNDPSAILTSPMTNANGSEGDINFRHGFVANEIDALPILDVRDGSYGLHASGEFYLNTPYLGTNQNNQPDTLNPFSVGKNTDFTSATRNVNGENARLLDAFAFGEHQFADGQSLQLKVGRQTLLWGQSLLVYGDSIAAGQAPQDIITAQSLPNAQAQQVFLPVGQAVVTYQPTGSGLTLQGYYQFEWQHDVFQGVGSYFSTADILDKGGERLILGPNIYLYRTNDLNPPSQNGQFGVSVKDTISGVDLGVYALRFDSKTPEVYIAPGATTSPPSAGSYTVVYPRDIAIYGASFSTGLGPANIAGEISGRTNQPLASGPGGAGPEVSFMALPGNAGTRPLYAVGNTIAGQVSMLYSTPPLSFDPGGIAFVAEGELNHVLMVTQNKAAMTPGRQATAGTFAGTITPEYTSVLPDLDVTLPIGIGYDFLGNSEMDSNINHGNGYFNVGVTGIYRNTWSAGLTYFDYLGAPNILVNKLADRGYVEFNVQHTF